MTKIRGNRTRKVVRAVTIVKVYRRPYPHHGNTSSCSRTLIVWKQSLEPRPTDLEALGMAHPRGGFSYVLAYNSADSESREPVLQHAMYYRLYHRSWFAGRKTYARHVPRRGAPAGTRDRNRRSITEGWLLAIQAAWNRPGNPSGCQLSQAK